MQYDPFRRGPHPVGVRTLDQHDPERNRRLPVELWYPAADTYAGQDLRTPTQDQYQVREEMGRVRQAAIRDATPTEAGNRPLILFSHGLGGHRRQSTFLTTHLASHGFVVAAPDHVGNTLPDMMAMSGQARWRIMRALLASALDRPRDVYFLCEALTRLTGDLAGLMDGVRIGVAGHSFGGWTTIAATSRPSRIRSGLALAPIGVPRATGLRGRMNPYVGRDLGYRDRPPMLILAADRDSLCGLRSIRRLHGQLNGRSRLLVLSKADHFHFCDRPLLIHDWFTQLQESGGLTGLATFRLAPLQELVAEQPAHDFIRGLGLAHFDCHLRQDADARAFLSNGVADALARRGVTLAATE